MLRKRALSLPFSSPEEHHDHRQTSSEPCNHVCDHCPLWRRAPDEQAKEVQRTGYTLSGPYTHQNLTVFFIHGADRIKDKVYLTLSEALEQKKAIVHETKEVQELAVENLSADEILIQSGDIVKGGQQDRILAMDLIVPAKSGKEPVKVAIASFCCEAGRWAPRGTEEVARFAPGNFQAATKDLKVAVRSQRAQQAVWDNVSRADEGRP